MASIFGTNGTDVNLTGTADADDIFGWASGGNETSDSGNDNVFGLAGNDQLFGGGGNDVLDGGAGADILDGGDGTDIASYASANTGVLANMLDASVNTADAAGDRYVSVTGLRGTSFADTLTGDNNDNIIEGGDGADTIYGLGGNDFLYSNVQIGGSGTGDVLIGGAGADVLNVLGGGSVSYQTSPGGVNVSLQTGRGFGSDAEGDIIGGFNGRQNLIGSNFDDVLIGLGARRAAERTSADEFYGLDGNDELHGGGNLKNELFDGGAGNDRIWGYDGEDVLIGGTGADVLSGGEGLDHAVFHQSTAAVTVNLTTGTGEGGDAQGDLYGSIEDVTGSDFADQITGDNAANTVLGRLGDDRLWGMDGNDFLIGGAGADVLTGGAGQDYASYVNANDSVRVVLFQGIGRYSDAEGDLFGSIENVIGSEFADELFGDNAANSLVGLGGHDNLYGEEGNDELDGGDGFDKLYGMDGNDILIGRLGIDRLVGGVGADTFVFVSTSDSLTDTPDEIVDFTTAHGDLIDLSDIDANTLVASDQAFTFIGTSAFNGTAGQLHYVGGRFLEGDVDGNGTADFCIQLNVASLAGSDFIL